MAAFDRIESGIPSMDKALDSIRLGDNVAWRVSSFAGFRDFACPSPGRRSETAERVSR